MNDLPMEVWEDHELISEFHRAGIYLPGEREAIERAREMHAKMGQFLSNLALQQQQQTQSNPFDMQLRQAHALQNQARSGHLSALGSALGSSLQMIFPGKFWHLP